MPVSTSSAIAWFDYDAHRQQLSVTFRGTGKTYVYFDVPPREFRAFTAAPSKGRFFNQHIKDHYAFRQR